MRRLLPRRVALALLALLALRAPGWAAEGIGAEAAAPRVAAVMAALPAKPGILYRLSRTETLGLVAAAAEIQINVFELLDCGYRYLEPRGLRIRLAGEDLRAAELLYDLGRERVNAILPVEAMESLELGAVLGPDQAAMEVRLERETSTYIEIGTAKLATRFGFKNLSPLSFDGAFGIRVQRAFFLTDFLRIELYAPGKAALYAAGVPKPKRWNIWMVRKR